MLLGVRRPGRGLAAAVLLVALGPALPGPAAAAPDTTTVEATPAPATAPRVRNQTGRVTVPHEAWVVLRGRGWGHGHGMSQYGAGGAAAAGRTWEQITSFYYPGTSRAQSSGDISVLISAASSPDTVVRAQPGLVVRDAGGRTVPLPSGVTEQWRIATQPDGTTGLFRRAPGDAPGTYRWVLEQTVGARSEFWAGGAPMVLVTPSGDAAYRGRLVSVPTGGLGRVTVNVLALDDYLRGVVPSEMPSSWPAEAVAAQAVAARTYAAYERAHAPAGRAWQVCDTTWCQVYGGYWAESAASDAAVAATSGVVLTWQGTPAFTQFTSSNGGWSSAGSAPYLTAQRDPYDGWRPNPNHLWLRRVSDATIEAHWPAVGDLTGVQVSGRDGQGQWGGRVTVVTLTGTHGRVRVSGADWKAALGLKESYWSLVGARRRW